MTARTEMAKFARADGLLWRDTGQRVLVLPPGAGGEVTVLGGGSAAIWRLLETPSSAEELAEALARSAENAPETDELARCLRDLVDGGALDLVVDRS